MDPISVENSVPSTSVKHAYIPQVTKEFKLFVGKTFESLEEAEKILH